MAFTATPFTSLAAAGNSVVDVAASSPESLFVPRRPIVKALCSFCLAEYPNRPEDGVENASVRYHGVLACSFHADFVWGDMPGRRFLRGEA